MRIWAFPSFYPIEYEGLKWHGIFAHRQYKGLIENGADLKVIQPVIWYPPFPFYLLDKHWRALSKIKYPLERDYDGIKVYHPRRANMKPARLFNIENGKGYIESILNFFRKNNIQLDPKKDIFYSQWLLTAGYVQEAAHQLGVKSAILAIGDDVNIWPQKNAQNLAFFQKTWREADFRMAVAAYLADEANKLVNEKLPYYVVRRGVEYDKFVPVSENEKGKIRTELNLPNNKIIILCVGAPIAVKGWLDLFDALAELKKINPDFLLAGINSGYGELDLNQEASKRGIQEVFLNLGEVEPQKINKLYNATDIFCLPSHWEGIANAVVEAMSCGLPVITTNVCGHPELITNGQNGILIPPREPDMLYNELLKLVSSEARRKELGSNARNFIVKEWGSFAQNALKLYKILSSSES